MIDELKKIDTEELLANAPVLAIYELKSDINLSWNEAASLMVKGGPIIYNMAGPPRVVREDFRPPKEYWEKLKKEFYLFLCTEDPKYNELRSKVKTTAPQSGKVLLATISSYFGSMLGVESGIIIGLLSVCIYATIKLGKEAYCAALQKDT